MEDDATTRAKAKILVVDDVLANRKLLCQILDQADYDVYSVPTGEAALEVAPDDVPDLILLDVNMPGMNGYEVCRRLRMDGRTNGIPIIFITALNETQSLVEGFRAGGVDYISKPIQSEELLARVSTHINLSQLQHHLEQRVRERTAELQELNTIYEKYVPREFINLLRKDSIRQVRLGDHIQAEMTVFFSDLHGWTTLSEAKTPRENFDFINDYFRLVSPVVRDHHGFVDQYYGDGIMALFPQTPDDAVRAAIAVHRRMDQYREESGLPEHRSLHVGIGMHTGSLALGILGEENRMQGGVVSDNVNLASRLEGLTRQYAANIIVSEACLNKLRQESQFNSRFIDKVRVKGKHHIVAVYEILDGDAPKTLELKLMSKADFEDGLHLYYQREFAEAGVKFNRVLKRNPQDQAARLYLERSAQFMVSGVPEDWQGTTILHEK